MISAPPAQPLMPRAGPTAGPARWVNPRLPVGGAAGAQARAADRPGVHDQAQPVVHLLDLPTVIPLPPFLAPLASFDRLKLAQRFILLPRQLAEADEHVVADVVGSSVDRRLDPADPQQQIKQPGAQVLGSHVLSLQRRTEFPCQIVPNDVGVGRPWLLATQPGDARSSTLVSIPEPTFPAAPASAAITNPGPPATRRGARAAADVKASKATAEQRRSRPGSAATACAPRPGRG